MTRQRLLALIVLATGACSSQPTVGSRFSGPSATVAFRGFSRKDAAIQDYVAVASSRGDEIRFVDPGDLNPVLSPGAVFPLSIPTAPWPLLLASASLAAQEAPLDRADVLVAASAGGAGSFGSGPALQLIETWDQTNRVARDVALGAPEVPGGLPAGSDILCMAGMPATSTNPARILVGASGGQLVVIPFTRATDGSGAVVPGTPAVRSLGFDPVDIAVSPDGTAIYIATRDPITTTDPTFGSVFGVAKINATGDIVSGALTALAAGPKDPDGARIGAGTIAVAAASGVLERTGNSSDQDSANRFTSPTSYVYAALDPASCGHDKAIDCGIVTIDPTSTSAGDRGNLALDPAASVTPDSGPAATRASPQAYRAPMPIPGVPLHIVISGPPASGSQRVTNDPVNPGVPLLNIAPGTGSTTTAAVAMVASSDGHVYWLDLSRWGPPSDLPIARGGVAVTLASSSAVPVGNYQLGLWQDVAPFGSTAFTPAVRTDSVGLISAIDVWPGFTDSDNWTIVYQGALPSLASRQGVLVGTSTGTVAAIQTSTGLVGANIADPSLGVTPGDIVELPGICEARVAAVLPADPTFPGGALQLDLTASGVTCTANQLPPAGASTPTTITVRASGLVLSNSKLGHLGRPVIARPSDAAADTTYAVSWGSTINGGIAADGPGPTSPPLARALARKARRLFYPGADGPCPLTIPNATAEQRQTTGCYGTSRQRITDPLAPGPIIRFRVGLVGPNPSDPTAIPPRDASISFTTSVGLSQTSRKPTTNGVRPGAAIPFDRTARDPAGNAKPQLVGHENDPIFFFVPYLDDQVLVFSTTQSSTQLVSIR